MITKEISKDLEGGSRDAFEDTDPEFAWRDRRIHDLYRRHHCRDSN